LCDLRQNLSHVAHFGSIVAELSELTVDVTPASYDSTPTLTDLGSATPEQTVIIADALVELASPWNGIWGPKKEARREAAATFSDLHLPHYRLEGVLLGAIPKRWADENVAAVSIRSVALASRVAKNLGGLEGRVIWWRTKCRRPPMRRQLIFDSVPAHWGAATSAHSSMLARPPKPPALVRRRATE
jgi:hypothetical protein